MSRYASCWNWKGDNRLFIVLQSKCIGVLNQRDSQNPGYGLDFLHKQRRFVTNPLDPCLSSARAWLLGWSSEVRPQEYSTNLYVSYCSCERPRRITIRSNTDYMTILCGNTAVHTLHKRFPRDFVWQIKSKALILLIL